MQSWWRKEFDMSEIYDFLLNTDLSQILRQVMPHVV